MASKTVFRDAKTAFAFLQARYGIPKSTCDQLRLIFAQDALIDGMDMGFNRLYTGVALMLHRTFGFGQKRLTQALKGLDDIMTLVTDKGVSWEELMRTLDEETGLIIRQGDDGNWICEYKIPEELKTGKLLD